MLKGAGLAAVTRGGIQSPEVGSDFEHRFGCDGLGPARAKAAMTVFPAASGPGQTVLPTVQQVWRLHLSRAGRCISR